MGLYKRVAPRVLDTRLKRQVTSWLRLDTRSPPVTHRGRGAHLGPGMGPGGCRVGNGHFCSCTTFEVSPRNAQYMRAVS
jgi:hypothetical protein